MDELISKQALKADLLKRGFFPVIVKCALEAAPAVDAVEVVRCEKCKHLMEYNSEWKEKTGAHGDCRIRKLYGIDEDFIRRKPNDFCSDGERKNK